MSWRLVDGVPVPDAVGGHPALDFCNTRAGWGAPAPKEYLTGPHALVVWARSTGLLPPHGPVPSNEPPAHEPPAHEPPAREPLELGAGEDDALARALALREALYACALHRGRPGDWALVSAEAARARAAAVLVPGPDGQGAVWQADPALGAAGAALTAVATAAEDLLTSSLSGFVAACPGEGCGWLFADRRRKRRWCSMAACGNRAKARRYAERRAADGPVTQRSVGTTNRPNS